MNSLDRTLPLKSHLDAQAARQTEQCTQCGKCAEVCPVVHEASDLLRQARPVEIVTDLVDFLQTGRLTDLTTTWAELCTGSGTCITHCPEKINPRQMLAIALNRIRAKQSESGNNPGSTYYRRMSQIIKLAVGMQMAPQTYRRIIGKEGNNDRAEVVFYIGCNVLRTPAIVFTVMDILDELDVDYAMLGGTSNCCGIIHLKFHGDVNGADMVASRTIDKLAAFEPDKVLHWCPSCMVEFGETIHGFRPYPFEFQHVAHFLHSRLDVLKRRFKPLPVRVALHRHDGGLGIDRSIENILAAIPELELVPIEEEPHWTYTCGPGALNNVQQMRERAHRQTVTSAVEAGAGILATLYHTCHRDLCVFEGQYPIQVKNWTAILALALGMPEHEDRYKQMKLHGEIAAALSDAAPFIEAHGLDTTGIETTLQDLMKGKEAGLSVW